MIPVWTIDFETHPIGPRPEHYPPKPVGVSIRPPDGPSRYYAWGHPSGNNCTFEDAAAALRRAWIARYPILFHNAKFDIDVAVEWFGLDRPTWARVHDTMFLAFLMSPYERTLGLKKLAEVWLGMPPDERDAVNEWILAHKHQMPLFEFVTNSKGETFGLPTKKNAGAWIGFAPGELVGPYAEGDTERTWQLFQTLMSLVQQSGMGDAYNIERQVMPIFAESERVGVRVDMERLAADITTYKVALGCSEDWLRWRLNSGGLNLDADADVADALDRNGLVSEWAKTASGKKSVSKDNLFPEHFTDPQVASMLGYRNRLKTTLDKHMVPMLKQAEARGGVVMGEWNQVASPDGGTRTGRPSMRGLNLLNVSKDFSDKGDGYVHPDGFGLPELPLVRKYILPDDGQIILKRDFSGQEMHIFGHYENGELQQRYLEDPRLDVHKFVGDKAMAIMGREVPRTNIKVLNFQGLYGGGVPAAAKKMRVSYDEAKAFKQFHDQALPGRKILSDTLAMILRSGMAVRTYGGRLYVREPVKWDEKKQRWSDHDYAMINYLIQGSAADITKRAMIAYHDHPDRDSRFMFQCYDELDISAPVDIAAQQMQVLKEAMESIPLRTGLPSDGEWGFDWGSMKDWDEDVGQRNVE